MTRRPELLSSVLLRQNPHNVDEWLKRALLFETDLKKV
jgi:pre-mRNA-splicing factor SYF1